MYTRLVCFEGWLVNPVHTLTALMLVHHFVVTVLNVRFRHRIITF